MRKSRALSEAFYPLEVWEYSSPAHKRQRVLTRFLVVLSIILLVLLVRDYMIQHQPVMPPEMTQTSPA